VVNKIAAAKNLCLQEGVELLALKTSLFRIDFVCCNMQLKLARR